MLTFVVTKIDGTILSIEAMNMIASDGVACFHSNSGRLLKMIPLHQICDVEVVWPVNMADQFDAMVAVAKQAEALKQEAEVVN